MTKYLDSGPFSVASPGTEEYRQNWERIFGKKTCPYCNTEECDQSSTAKPSKSMCEAKRARRGR